MTEPATEALTLLEAIWTVEPGGEDHNPWVLADGQRIAEVWGPNDLGSDEYAALIRDALEARAQTAAPEGPDALREALHRHTCGIDARHAYERVGGLRVARCKAAADDPAIRAAFSESKD